MEKVLMIQYPSISHLNASYRVAQMLVKNNYEVYYFVNNKIAGHVHENKYKFYTAFSAPIAEKYDEKGMKLDNIKYTYFERLRDAVMRLIFDNRRNELCEAIDEIEPSIIIADTFAGSDFALIYQVLKQRKIRFFHMETMLSSTEHKGVPYLMSKAFPNQRVKIYMEQLTRKLERGFYRLRKRVAYLGYDNYTMLKREIKAQKLPEKYKIDFRNYCDLAFTNIPSLLTAPAELEFFSVPANTQQHYLGFFVNNNAKINPVVDERLAAILKSGKKIIYISFGTVFGDAKADTILAFMKKLNIVLADIPDIAVVFSLGKAKWSRDEMMSLNNINIFTFVPQVYLLQYCCLFITHGGLNSIKESIQEAVPMLAIPLDIDQIGNARKITYRKLGMMGRIKQDSIASLKEKVETLLSDDSFKENIIAFRQQISEKYDLEKILIPIIKNEGLVD